MGYHRSFFGIGSITAIPSGATPTPVDVAVIRGATVEFKSTTKPLKGSLLSAIDAATTDVSITGKIQAADFSASMVSLVLPGTTSATGRRKMTTHPAPGAAAVTIPTTPFQVTVTQSATWVTDFGVVNLTTGKTMTRGATATATGVYSVAAGVYTFNTADTGSTILIRYAYTDAASGSTITATNQAVGATTGFALHLFDPPGGTKEAGIYLPAVRFSNLSLGMKTDDWSESGLDFEAYADATGNLFYGYADE